MVNINWIEENKKIEDFLNIIPEPIHKTIPEGILICSGSTHFISALLILKQLEYLQNSLPIEFYYCGDELFPHQIQFIQSHFPSVQLFNCLLLIPPWFPWKINESHIKGYMIKSFCMMISKIKNIFFIDSDNIPFQKIEELFLNKNFLVNHNIFWPDIEFGSEEGKKLILKEGEKIYQNLQIESPSSKNIIPCESGQILMNSVFCWKAVCLSYYFNYFYPIYYSLFFGDKDLYYVAFQKTNTPYFLNPFKPYICNHKDHKFGLLSSIFQRDPSSGKPIFLHHTKSKINIENTHFLQYIYPSHHQLLNEKDNLYDLYYDFEPHLNTTFVTYIHKKLNMKELQNLITLLQFKFSHTLIFVNSYEIKNIVMKMTHSGKLFSKIEVILLPLTELPFLQLKNNYYFSKANQYLSNEDLSKLVPFDLFHYIYEKQIKTKPYLIYYSLSKDNKDILHEPFFRLSEDMIYKLDSKCGLFENQWNDIIILSIQYISQYHSLFHSFFTSSLYKKSLPTIFYDFYLHNTSLFTLFQNYKNSPSELNLLHDHSLKYLIDIPPYVITFYKNVYLPFLQTIQNNYQNPIHYDTYKNEFIQSIQKSKKNVYQHIIIDEKLYKDSIQFMNIFFKPLDPFFLLTQFEYELCMGIHKTSIHILFKIILENNFHNLYEEFRIIIFKFIHIIYCKDNFHSFIDYFDNLYYFSLIVRLQCYNTISINECIEFLQKRSNHSFISDMIPIFQHLKSKPSILIEKIDVVIQHLQNDDYGSLSFIRPFYFNQFYFLTYLNQNNCEIRKKVSLLHRLLFPSIVYSIDFQNQIKKKPILKPNELIINKNRKKIGFLSHFFKSHSVGRDRIGVIRGINYDIFEVHLFHLEKHKDDYYHLLCKTPDITNHYIDFPSILEMRQYIENIQLDILVYADIGMIEESYLLAHSRLAPIQINTIGHSETSGIPTLDYYVSSILSDNLELSQSHYSEKLILTNSINTFYYRDFYDLFEKQIENNDSLLPLQSNKIYISYLQNSLKAGEEDLQLLYQLLHKIPSIHLVLINLIENPLEENKLKTYLKPFFDQNRILLLSKLNTSHFYSLIKKSYLLLDAFPHGGCNTSLECFHFGKIMITRPSSYLRGRFTLGFYQKMGIHDCIVNSVDEYIEKVIYFIENPDKKLEVEEKIKNKSHLLFHDYQSIVDWNNLLIQLTQK